MLVDLSFPPLMRGEAAPFGVDPMAQAVSTAALGCDPGLIVHNAGGQTLSAALVLAPEAQLGDAMAMLFAASVGLSDALGALAPPEVAVHFDWPAAILVNQARCGLLRARAATADPEVVPDWLVVGFDLWLTLPGGDEPGKDPLRTALSEEGCLDVEPFRLLEGWSRHTLFWINSWLETGMERLHGEWRGRAASIGEEVDFDLAGARHRGIFVGLDDRGGMLLRQGDRTTMIPLTAILEG